MCPHQPQKNTEKENEVNEERKPVHSQEPAEGAEEDTQAPGADKADEGRGEAGGPDAEERSAEHPREPAEGGEDEAEAPGADRPQEAG
jgi:hypothetical protein